MENSTKISLKKIREAIKQADANIKFEEININQKKIKTQDKTKILRRGNNYDRRTLG